MNEHLCLLVGLHFSNCNQHPLKRFWTFTVSISPELNSFLLIMRIDSPGKKEFALLWSRWTKCQHYLCLNWGTERRALRIHEFVNMFTKSHAALRAHLSWFKVSSCDLSPNVGAQRLRSWGAHFGKTPLDGPLLSRILIWRKCPWRISRRVSIPKFHVT